MEYWMMSKIDYDVIPVRILLKFSHISLKTNNFSDRYLRIVLEYPGFGCEIKNVTKCQTSASIAIIIIFSKIRLSSFRSKSLELLS